MELLTKEARRVWIPNHPTLGYAPGRVDDNADDGDALCVVDDEGAKYRVPKAEALGVDPACLTGVDDLLVLGDFNEPALLHNIRVRYLDEKIYTGIGNPILISVNPYQNIPGLYSQERMKEYKRGGSKPSGQGAGGLPIHVYSIADAAYRAMLQEQSSQSIIISGESGAGETEATKRILAYLAELQARGETGAAKRSVESQVLDANPVLEAFGNAKTVRNDNSSRFGKFIEVEFDSGGKLLSAQISNYLLEKCRIITQQPEERNYHIFYQVCAGADRFDNMPEGVRSLSAADFEYTAMCDAIPGVDDAADFKDVLDCMTSLGFTLAERNSALQIVSAVLHLGQLSFSTCAKNGQDGVVVKDDATVALICKLLGVQPERLREVLEQKTLEDPLTKKTIHMPHDTSSASLTRHSMAKVVYARLFDWLVWRINESISSKAANRDVRKIGLLDIFGFEVFEWNSFEQLCINFANEKLQQHFNSHMFTLEQRLYNTEGIAWNHITFQDNQHIIDSLDKKPLGLFCLIDSECLMPAAKDSTLFGKIENTFKNNKVIYKASRFASMDFAVAHYAGEVVYCVDTFLEKNTDKLHADIVNLLKESKLEVVHKLFTDPRFAPETSQKGLGAAGSGAAARRPKARAGAGDDHRGGRQNVTVSMMFREQLERLVDDLNKTNPRYVRCIKPNANKMPGEIDSVDVLRQLRCAGMLESIRIRRAGYAVRRPFKEFFNRFRILAPHVAASGPDPDYRSLCQRLLTHVEERLRREGTVLDDKPSQIGHTRVFMKEEFERHMERLIVESAKRQVAMIQRCWRGFMQRRRYRAIREAALEVQAALRTNRAMRAYQELKQRHYAAVQLQASLRVVALREAFLRKRKAAVTFQRFARGWRCRRRLGGIKSKAAAEKLRRLREEEERRAAFEKAREEAQRKEEENRAELERVQEEARRKDAELEAMRQRLEQTQRNSLQLAASSSDALQAAEEVARERARVAAEDAARKARAEEDAAEREREQARQAQIAQMEEENRLLKERLQAAEEAKLAQEAAKRRYEEELREQRQREAAAEQKAAALERAMKEMQTTDVSSSMMLPKGLDLDTSIRNAELKLGGESDAVRQLRSELLVRLGGGMPMGAMASPSPSAIHALGSSLRPDKGDLAKTSFEDDLDPPMRKTIMNQRQIFEQLKAQMREATESTVETRDIEIDSLQTVSSEQVKQLEEDIRRLRKENAALKTSCFSSQEEATERASEASALLQQVSMLQAELEDLRYSHRGELQANIQQLHVLAATSEQQIADIQRQSQRANEAEGRAARFETEARQLEAECQAKQEQLDRLEENLQVLRSGMAESDQADHRSRQENQRLKAELENRSNELVNVKQVLDNVMNAHVPVEEAQKWKVKAQSLEQQYSQALRSNQQFSAAWGLMSDAASARGGDLRDLQIRLQILEREQEEKDQELKTADLEKKDMQAQMENMQSSCTYFQNKYKATAAELRKAQKEHAQAAEGFAHARAQVSELAREREGLCARVAKLNERQAQAQGQNQEQGHRLMACEDCLKELLALHAEQLSAAGKSSGSHTEELREKTRSTVSRLRSLLGGARETASGSRNGHDAGAGHGRAETVHRSAAGYPAAAMQQQQQAKISLQQSQEHHGRASLLSQMNMSQQFKS
eukprot:TRINITY_DN57282_c0_g1_i1.p1 TRINITY_DN57282_c0_g1~~TRINITY_DN57282_c0_g1_i1.p1  ORF type:complete len:1652 (+),score=454.86 TRINITY_DN57282_c0_g1_i1:128-5083(+)